MPKIQVNLTRIFQGHPWEEETFSSLEDAATYALTWLSKAHEIVAKFSADHRAYSVRLRWRNYTYTITQAEAESWRASCFTMGEILFIIRGEEDYQEGSAILRQIEEQRVAA